MHEIPSLYINHMPFYDLPTYGKCMVATKRLFNNQSGKELNLSEHLEHSYFEGQLYEENHIKIRDLSPDEILQVVQRFVQVYLNGHPVLDSETQLRANLTKELNSTRKNPGWHKYIHPEFLLYDTFAG